MGLTLPCSLPAQEGRWEGSPSTSCLSVYPIHAFLPLSTLPMPGRHATGRQEGGGYLARKRKRNEKEKEKTTQKGMGHKARMLNYTSLPSRKFGTLGQDLKRKKRGRQKKKTFSPLRKEKEKKGRDRTGIKGIQ